MRRTSLVLAAAGGAAVLAVAGVALGVTSAGHSTAGTALTAVTTGPTTDDNPKPDDDATSNATASSATASSTAPGGTASGATSGATDGAVSRKRAGEIALAGTGGGRIVEIEAEMEHGHPVWSVKVVKGATRYEVKVDRGDGTVVETERERADDRGGDRHRSDDR
ncbi:PepSY domain-containing protein [Micromonospora sp. NPDC007271]|uniref:PepSY domain-containing protein n=1 Tax=Micromonospora sp. NPDC007271 TaxID=3154587 RepID=UPI0033E6F97B